MQIHSKIQRRLIFLIILTVIVVILTVALSNFTYAQETLNLHQKTLDVISNHTTSSKHNAHITVGKNPKAISAASRDKIYVVNEGDGTVSVIDGNSNTKIGNDIKVGNGPNAMIFDNHRNTTI